MNQRVTLAIPLLTIALAFEGCGFSLGGRSFTDGALNRARFGWDTCSCGTADRGMAAGGAQTSLTIQLPAIASADTVGKVEAHDGSILTVDRLEKGVDPSGGTRLTVHLTSGNPGSTPLTVFDTQGQEIDHAMVTVAPTVEIGIDQGWTGDVLNVVAGQSFAVHAITWGEGHVDLTGVGAIQFAYQGILKQASTPDTTADQEQFRAPTPGDGAVVMTAISATRTVEVHAVDPMAVDGFRANQAVVPVKAAQSTLTGYAITAGGVPVYGQVCRWTVADPSIASVSDLFSSIGAAPSAAVFVKGLSKGTTRATCSLNGRSAGAIDVEVD